MKLSLVALCAALGSAAAFVPTGQNAARTSSVAVKESIADLEALAAKSNPVLKFYDPLELSTISIWGQSNEATISFLRHSEIKHGRVAMAAFVGYLGQSKFTFPWPITLDGTPHPGTDLSPPEQWDALPVEAKWQIILFIGFLEWFSEAAGTHYMRGGTPGAFPKFSDHKELIPHPMPLGSLFDPFGLSTNASKETKEAGLVKELNNGRLAQIGILGFLAEQKVEGSVPLLKGIVGHYSGEPMAPFQ